MPGLSDEQREALMERIPNIRNVYSSVGDICTETRDPTTALEAYEAAVRAERDPERQCELGYMLLQRCRVAELPLCERGFDGCVIDLGHGDHLYPWSYLVEPDEPGPEFPDKASLLGLAIRAFGLAWLYYSGHAEERSQVWRALLALDGLRVAFLHTSSLGALEQVCQTYYDWVEHCQFHDFVGEFEASFRETMGYLRGRREAAFPGSTTASQFSPDLQGSQRLIIWQLKELLSEVRESRITPDEIESIASRVGDKVAEKIAKSAPYVLDSYEGRLALELGSGWYQLPTEVRRMIIQAEHLRHLLQGAVDSDWAPVVLQYVRALESHLRTLGPRLDEAFRRDHPYARANIGAFRRLFAEPQFVQFAVAHGLSTGALMAELAPDLDRVVKSYRNPAVHGAEPTSPVKVEELRRLLIGTEAHRPGLLWRVASLSSSDQQQDGSD